MIIRMKIAILFFLLLTLSNACVSVNHDTLSSVPSLVGTWEGTSEGEVGRLIFLSDGKTDVIKNGDSLRERVIKNRGDLVYSIDTSKNPMHLDVVAIDTSGNELGRLKMIYQYINEDSITSFPNGRKSHI
jgi:hypothetical protein